MKELNSELFKKEFLKYLLIILRVMENTLLYFYSTIPQVLAAIIALIFVFVSFKLQDFDKMAEIQSSNFAKILGNNVKPSIFRNWQDLGSSIPFMTSFKLKYFKNISTLMNKICDEREKDDKIEVEKLRRILTETIAIEKQRRSLISNSRNLCAFGFSIIIGSIIIIHFVNNFSSNNLIINLLFVVFILLTGTCLFFVYKILSYSLKN